MMKKLMKYVLTIVFLSTMSLNVSAQTSEFDWNPVIDAIVQVESRGNVNARNGIYAGPLQISPGLVTECNNIMKRRGSSKRYTLADRYNMQKSREMFVIIQSYYNPENNVERAIRSWQGGIRYKVRSTQRYYEKVMSYM
jgi:hypothetical protein